MLNMMMCGQKAVVVVETGVVISLLHGEGVVDGAIIDSASPPATYTKLASGGYFTNYPTSLNNKPVPVGAGCILMGYYDSGTEVQSNTFAGVSINTPLTMEGYFIYEALYNNEPQYIAIVNTSGVESVKLSLLGSIIRAETTTGAAQVPESQFPKNVWHFTRVSFDGTDLKVYVDGILRGTVAGTVDLSGGFYISFKVGAVGSGITIDEFRVTIGQALGAGMPALPLTTAP